MALKTPDKVKLRIEYSNSFNRDRSPSKTGPYRLVFNLVVASTKGQIAALHHIGDYSLYNMYEVMQFRDSNEARIFLENYIGENLNPLEPSDQSWINIDDLLLDFLEKGGDVLVFD